jgi:hypothetical protein
MKNESSKKQIEFFNMMISTLDQHYLPLAIDVMIGTMKAQNCSDDDIILVLETGLGKESSETDKSIQQTIRMIQMQSDEIIVCNSLRTE